MKCIYYYDAYKCLILANSSLNKDVFCKKAGANTGYAKDIFSRIYDSIFSEAEDVIECFNNYYVVEYNTFEDYLLNKYSIANDKVHEIIDTLHSHPLKLYDVDTLFYGDSAIYDFWSSDNMINRILDLIVSE